MHSPEDLGVLCAFEVKEEEELGIWTVDDFKMFRSPEADGLPCLRDKSHIANRLNVACPAQLIPDVSRKRIDESGQCKKRRNSLIGVPGMDVREC